MMVAPVFVEVEGIAMTLTFSRMTDDGAINGAHNLHSVPGKLLHR
jgi:hypothetical protein